MKLGALGVAGMTVVLLCGSTAAVADTTLIKDPDEPSPTANTSAVRVSHYASPTGRAGRVKIVIRAGNVEYGDRFSVWIDTPGASNPRYYARVYPEAGYGAVLAVDGWSTTGDPACQRWEARLVTGENQKATFGIPRTCLGEPGRVRVATLAVYERDGRAVRDWVKGTKQFGPWVRVSTAG